jgi:type II secretory pathway pseudopilin PulG
LVVVAIIGVLATLVIINVTSARSKSRDSKRAGDIAIIKKVVESYQIDNNGVYPAQPDGCAGPFSSPEVNYATYVPSGCLSATGYIKGVSAYISVLPKDPGPVKLTGSENTRGYMYRVTAAGYKIIAHHPENCTDKKYRNIIDPERDDDIASTAIEDASCWAWAYYSPGAEEL